jgi:hypothetical protein
MAEAAPALKTNIVIVKIDPKLAKLTEPEYFDIKKHLHEQVKWVSADPDAYFTVEFEHGSPFHYTQFSTDFPYSGLVRREVLGDPGKKYKYTVRFEEGKKSIVIDPGGVVNP